MATRLANGYSDADVHYAAAQYCAEGYPHQLRFVHGEEVGGQWRALFIFDLGPGKPFCAVWGEEKIDRTETNWTTFIHNDFNFIKNTYMPNFTKPWAQTNVANGANVAVGLNVSLIPKIRKLMSEEIPTIAKVDDVLNNG